MTTMISEVYSAFKTAGVPEQEARRAAEALSAENLATRHAVAEDKRDLAAEIAELRQELYSEIAGVRQEIAEVKQELSSEIAGVRQELSSEIAKVRQELSSEIGEIRREMGVTRWMLGVILVVVALPILREIVATWL